jgi:carboxyl-terminal processing protease
MERLKKNSALRILNNKNYQNFIKELKKNRDVEDENPENFGQNDLQLAETENIMRDLLFLMLEDTGKHASIYRKHTSM